MFFPSDYIGWWILEGNKLNIVSGGKVNGEILDSEFDILVIKFDFDYDPIYYYKKK